MTGILLGTSGWSYDEWVGPFYRSKSEPKLRRYSSLFETVEIDSTFYSYPAERTVAGMMRAVPEGFQFTAKVPGEVTHRLGLDVDKGALEAMERFTKLMKPMLVKSMLACLLLQLPPSMKYSPELLEKFLESVDRGFRYAVEFRHPSWIRDETFTLLRRLEAAYTIVDEPLLPPVAEVTTDFAYVRWHGRGKNPWYNYHYTEAELRGWVDKLQSIKCSVRRVYGYFNNHFHGYAVHNCIQVLEMLGQADERHKAVKTQLENYFMMTGIGGGEESPVASYEEKMRLLSSLVDIPRLRRASEIADEQVQIITASPNYIEAKIKEYTAIVDAEKMMIIHDCEDWRKGSMQNRLCKHLTRLFLSLPEDTAIPILKSIKSDPSAWLFEAKN
ncbi:MAG: DUF72 domain-containing protein [Aigarchaeota archaeon]|nr:DUF72 domain-containing protein [Candidatus Caldarchaeales archaeon]